MKKTIKHVLSVCLVLLSLTLIFASCADTTTAPSKETEPHAHAYGEWAVVKEPTCTEAGEKERTCSCGHKETETVAATGHTEVTAAAVDATCTAAGKTEGKHCSVCNAVIVAQTTVKATGHKYTAIVTPPTKTEEGYTTYTCKCGDSYVADKVPATGSVGLAYSVNSDGKTCTITGMGTCTDTEVIVAEIIDGCTVTAIGDKAFADQTSVISIVIPDTVKTIGKRAFYNTGITEFTVPASVTSIGTQIFYKAESLKTVYYNSTYYIDSSNQFLSTRSIKKIVFGGETVPSVLRGNTKVISVEIKDSVTSIGDRVFEGCEALTSITIPDSVTSIGGEAFSGCTSLTSITIPDSVTSIGYGAFEGCTSLTSITIGDGVTSIEWNAFYGCTSLTSFTIPDSVMSIGGSAFENCTSLTSITIPDSVTSIGGWAFRSCTALTRIDIPDSVTSIGGSAFENCTSLTSITIPDSVTSIGEDAFYGCKSLTSITILDGVTSIGYSAFRGCTSLTSITIPDSVTFIDWSAFSGCTSLTSIHYSGTIEQWNTIDKAYDWNINTGDYVVHCTDRDISK